MKQDEIKEKTYEVIILQRGRDGNTLCFKLYNEELGEFVIGNCHFNAEPTFFPENTCCLNGNTEIMIDGENVSFKATLVIYSLISDCGTVTLRC